MFSKLRALLFIAASVLIVAFLSCKNPTAASDEVLFVNNSEHYILVQYAGSYLEVRPNDDNKYTGVENSFSVDITYGEDFWPQNHTTLKSNYSVSPGETITISKDQKVSKS